MRSLTGGCTSVPKLNCLCLTTLIYMSFLVNVIENVDVVAHKTTKTTSVTAAANKIDADKLSAVSSKRGGGTKRDSVEDHSAGSVGLPHTTRSQQHQQQHNQHSPSGVGGGAGPVSPGYPIEARNSYAMLSQAMSQAVIHELNVPGSGSTEGTCTNDDVECLASATDRLGMEAIKQLHRQLDDDDNGNIDIAESDDFLREELKYDSGYEKRHRAFHYNDDMHISVKELWEAWLRSEVHNWTTEQTTEWLSQSVQLPQYVEIFKQYKVTGATLPRLAVNNMYYVSNVLGIRDPIHKQKIALKAMDVVLFGPPRETGTRWKDYVLVTLLLSAIIGCWYAVQQNKNAKRHLRRMAQDMEGLQKAERALQNLQTELEHARMEQESAASEKMDLLRRLKEQPSLSSSSSDLEVQKLKHEIELLRSELVRAEGELVDNCWTPPQGLQAWLQLTYELESRYHLKKRLQAEAQLQLAREACEKLKRKRSSLVGAFVSTHGKSIDDVDRSIVEARNSLSEVTHELQERMHRWKQIETLLGFTIINNNGLSHLESILYTRNGSVKNIRSRMSSSQDDLDEDSPQGTVENLGKLVGDDSSASDDADSNKSVTFILGSSSMTPMTQQELYNKFSGSSNSRNQSPATMSPATSNLILGHAPASAAAVSTIAAPSTNSTNLTSSCDSSNGLLIDENLQSIERAIVPVPRTKKLTNQMSFQIFGKEPPLPPPRRTTSHQSIPPGNPIAIAARGECTEILETSSIAQSTSNVGSTRLSAVATADLKQALLVNDHQLDDTYSTDSSSLDDEHKRRRRKLHFPFGKKKNKLFK